MKYLLLLYFLVIALAIKAQNVTAILNSQLPDRIKADSIFKNVRSQFQRANFEQTGKLLDAAMPLVLKINNDTLTAQFYIERANTYNMQGQPNNALQNLYNANEKLNKTFSYFNLNSSYILAAKSHLKLNNADSALYYYRKAEELNNKYNPYRNWITYVEMGSLFASLDNYVNAQNYYEKAYNITKTKGIRMDHGLTIYNLGSYYVKRNMADKFANIINEREEFNKTQKKDLSKDPVHNLLFVNWGNTPIAERINFYKSVKQKLINEGFFNNASTVSEEIYNIYEVNNQFDEALKYANESIDLSAKDGSSSNVYIYTKAAYRILKKAGRLQEAADMADKLFALKDSITQKNNLQFALDLDTKYLTDKKIKEIELLNTQNAIKEKDIVLLNLKNETNAKQIALLKSEKELKNLELLHQSALQLSLQRENLLKDSIVSQQKLSNELLSNENELKNNQLQKETALKASLNRENTLKAQQLIKEKKLRWSLLGGAGLLLAWAISIFALYRRQKIKNAIIQKQATDLEVLMKEIHHRVKNNLQVVSSLLDLQSHSITDVNASAAVREGKNRVQSMALIHQNLYSEGNIKGICVKEYISNLVQTLADSYNITNDKVKIITNIDDLKLDVDTMIPLGLMLNELVSNSFKYAFKNQQHGELNITLTELNEKLNLIVSDNGIGYPNDLNVKTTTSFGLKMIRAFAQKLKASLNIYNNNGAVVEMQITKYKAA